MNMANVSAPVNTTASTLEEIPLVVKKKGVPPVIMGVLTLVLIAGIAGGTFLMSSGVSSDKPISPNAPSSIPKAYDPNEEAGITAITKPAVTSVPGEGFDPNGSIDCTGIPNTAAYGNRCVATVKNSVGVEVWAPGAIEALTQ
jgi:hypothetical protein